MVEIEKYNQLPSKKNALLVKSVFPDTPSNDFFIELSITIKQTQINIKEFSSFLDLIYRIDGQLSELGYFKYAHIPLEQIEIEEIRFGSVEIIIQKLINSLDGEKLFFLYAFLMTLSTIAGHLLNRGVKLFELLKSKEDYLEKKDRRIMREIRAEVNSRKEVSRLDKKGKEKLINQLYFMYIKNSRRLNPALRFLNKYVRSIELNQKTNKI